MTTRELVERTQITGRQLQWWEEHRVIACRREGRRRVFDDAQALAALVIRELRRKGISLQRIRSWRLTPADADYLVTDGRRLIWCAREEVIPCVQLAPGPCWVICVADLRAEIHRAANGRPAPPNRRPRARYAAAY
jgi:MerR HTH family regulatory protein